MQKQTTNKKLADAFKSLDFFKSVVRHLEDIGQIKKKSSDKQVEEVYNKAKDIAREVPKFSSEEFLRIGKFARSFWEKGASENPPKFVIVAGGIGSGKTTLRRQQFCDGYVNFDFGDIHMAAEKVFNVDDPKFKDFFAMAVDMIFRESLSARKNIVIEIIGDNYGAIAPVIDKMKDIGYEVSVAGATCDPAEGHERHLKATEEDPEYFSSYYTQEPTLYAFYHHFGLGDVHEALNSPEGE